jgi:hypothetical protein
MLCPPAVSISFYKNNRTVHAPWHGVQGAGVVRSSPSASMDLRLCLHGVDSPNGMMYAAAALEDERKMSGR